MSQEATFWIRDIPIYGDAILSPMAGYSDVPYRAICRAYGSAMNYTEFVAVEFLQSKKPNPYWQLLDYTPADRPMTFQIFGNNARAILNAALRIEQWGPDIIDINMGCSTRKVSGRGAGVGMMRDPKLVAQTFSLLSQHLSIPVTAKMRLGWEDQVNYLEIARILEDNGCALIALHARTKEQKYSGTADWDAIARLREVVNIPIIGNGDVTTPEDIAAMKRHTGCDAVMIGRGAIGNPWIFAGRRREELSLGEIAAGVRLHLHEMLNYYDERGLTLFRKHLKRYFQDIPGIESQLAAMVTAPDPDELLALLTQLEAEFGTYPLFHRALLEER